MRRVLQAVALMPRNAIVLLLKGYRLAISPLYGDVCRYHPSCSRYTLEAVQHHGVLRGGLLGARRLGRCHPWASGGIDDIPEARHHRVAVNRFGFAVPATGSDHGKG